MASQKPRIIPWLIEQIDSQRYPGLVWLNAERTQFRIPWKHGSRQDRNEDDIHIFKAWAIASGIYDPSKDSPDPVRWKRNVRCALIQKDGIKMIQKNRSDPVNPHKIYELSNPAAHAHGATPEENDLNEVNPNFQQLTLGDPPGSVHGDNVVQQPLTSPPYLDLYSGASGVEQENVPQAGAAEFIPNPFVPYVPDAQGFEEQEHEDVGQNILLGVLDHNELDTHYDVQIYYRGTLIKKIDVKNPRGFRITSRQEPNPESHLEDVCLPYPVEVRDPGVGGQIFKLLDNLQEGFVIEERERAICAKRCGSVKAYWSTTEFPTRFEPNEIDKTDYTILYSMQQFVTELSQFVEGKRRESPQYSMWICLGQQWPHRNPWAEKFIMVKVTPVIMKLLHEMSYCGGASSLRSDEMSLELSKSLSISGPDDLLSVLKSMEQMMDYE